MHPLGCELNQRERSQFVTFFVKLINAINIKNLQACEGYFCFDLPSATKKPYCRKETACAAAVLFDLKFADKHYKLKSSQASKARLQSSKDTGVKQNLTQNGHSMSFKVTCLRSRVLESVESRPKYRH